jgi:broad specificity phosphatase PhoE
MAILYLVRHGETDYHVQKRALGKLNVPLNDLGKRQALRIASCFEKTPIAAIYSSPLRRCLETAQPLAKAKGLAVQPIEGITEIDLGEWDGKPFEELYREGGETFAAWIKRPSSTRIPGGETLSEVRDRVLEAVEEILKRHSTMEDIVIFGHGGPLRVVLCASLGLDLDHIFRMEVDLASISCIKLFNNTIKEHTAVTKVNDTCHLHKFRSETSG